MIYKNIIFLGFLVLFLNSCSYNYFNYDVKKESLSLPITEDKSMIISLNNPEYIRSFSLCSSNSYFIKENNKKYGKLFLENILLDSSCQWNGLASGYFIYELKNQMKFKDFKLIDKFKKDTYEISTYKINDDKYINIIELYSVSSNLFILDNKGVLSNELIKNLNPNYEFNYEQQKRANIDYNYSLVDNNFFKSYFSFERNFDRKEK